MGGGLVRAHVGVHLRQHHPRIWRPAVWMFITRVRTFIRSPGWRKLISAPNVLQALMVKWAPVSAVLPLSPPGRRLLTAKHVWIKQNSERGRRWGGVWGGNADIMGNEPFALLQPRRFSSLSTSFVCLFVCLVFVFVSFHPILLPLPCSGGAGWRDQVIKHRLQRLLRPQKEERRSRPQISTVATVGLEEMKSKVGGRTPPVVNLLRLQARL